MFYDSFSRICESVGISPSKVLKDIGMGKSVATNWKNGGEPSNPTKKKIADYFGITVKQLLSGEIEKPATKNDDGLTARKEKILSLMADLTEENQKKILELARMFVDSQKVSQDKK